ncbi:unnamed protein product [Rotaria sp. Silwood1]|nr:unnamed protein product [Rotaria sp. Silwood1]CAF3465149.1 unnamed protein product [Rotaria sp. Silwood1]CAF4607875.1 unnamed protein product [Rotaria sp. Silwood1]CAF4661707.1 unnamed protein product [Rotaria sp. Silwood1]CAF4672322.1 unnamed protein product [Rotaria sp. Silwood1]
MGSCRSVFAFQWEYVRSPFFVLKAIELFCDLLSIILCGAGPNLEEVVLLIICFINLKAMFHKEIWHKIEIGWCTFFALFYFIGSIVIATAGKENGVYAGAATFGFLALFAYIADGVYQFMQLRNPPRPEQYAPNQASGNA